MIITAELLKKLIGKHFIVQFQPGGFCFKETTRKGEYVVTDAGEQFIEAKAASSGKTSKHYFNVCSIQELILQE